jgi:uncharacterized protein (TIGR03083 family)
MSDPNIDLLDQVWTSIVAFAADLSEEEWKLPTDLPAWTVQDNLAHITGTERMIAGEPAPEVTPAHTEHVRNPLGEANEIWIEARRGWTGAEVLAEFEIVAAERLAHFRSLSDEQLDEVGPTPAGMAPFREFLSIRVMDSWAHEQDMRRAVGRPGDLTGPVADLALARISNTMPLIVGKRAAAPAGSSVVFALSRPGSDAVTRVPIAVAERAALVDEAPDDPTVTLAMDVETYAALAFGRWAPDAPAVTERVTITGDVRLGRAVLDTMAFMI